ncbi:hypothetical protein FF38_01947 [Lucilia cuprina]|uniref:Uncharacterized protein n=1 Tax=Lucilia cuprina TaxID=7375 RepID=A0A0L0CR73_LUCCU|nr:hypothetical protein FF38_01947 [Lucilia cuprina]
MNYSRRRRHYHRSTKQHTHSHKLMKIKKKYKNKSNAHAKHCRQLFDIVLCCCLGFTAGGTAAAVDVCAVTTHYKNEMKMLYEFDSSLFVARFIANWKRILRHDYFAVGKHGCVDDFTADTSSAICFIINAIVVVSTLCYSSRSGGHNCWTTTNKSYVIKKMP